MPDTIVTPYNRGPETVTIYLREGIVTVPALVESDEEAPQTRRARSIRH